MPPLGVFLGQLTDELPPGQYITEFISSGPKSYSYRLSDLTEIVKFKGIIMNPVNRQIITFENIHQVVTRGKVTRIPTYNMFVRDKVHGRVFNKAAYKTVKLVYTKRVLLDDYETLPFGY